MNVSVIRWDFALILVALAALVPWRGVVRVRQLLARDEISPAERMKVYFSTGALQWIAVALTAWRCAVHGVRPEQLGLSLPHPTAAAISGLALAVFFTFTQLLGFRALSQIPIERRGRIYRVACKIRPQSGVEIALFMALVFTVSLCEEFLYRGFAFAIFREVSVGSAVTAVMASSLLFAVGHLYQGKRGIVVTFFLGVVFAMARSLTASLLPGIIAHFTVDTLAGLAAPKTEIS